MDTKNQSPEFENIDRWLDIALRERANAEPRSGLEERVLTRLASQPKRRTILWWPAMTAAAVVFVIAVTLAVIYPRRQASRETPAQSPQSPVASSRDAVCCVSTKMAASTITHRAVPRPTVHVEPESLPKLATFPAPRPETAEERLLARV